MIASDSRHALSENQRRDPRERNILGWGCIVVVVGVLLCTLWPLNPFPANQVTWLSNRGVRLGDHGVLIGLAPLDLSVLPDNSKSFTLELWLQPASVSRSDTILSFYSPSGQFRIRQWMDGLLVSHGSLVPGAVNRSKFDVDHVFRLGKPVLMTIMSGEKGTTVYLNGEYLNDDDSQTFPKFSVTKADLSAQIILGTSAIQYQPWPGEIRGLAVYGRSLTVGEMDRHYRDWIAGGISVPSTNPDLESAIAYYAFNERSGNLIHNTVRSQPDLEIPRFFRIPHKTVLASLSMEYSPNWKYVSDVLQNIAGFIPVGFVICAYLLYSGSRYRVSAICLTILACAALSLSIELMQVYIPRRVSGLTDVITNTLGGLFGALLARSQLIGSMIRAIDWLFRARSYFE